MGLETLVFPIHPCDSVKYDWPSPWTSVPPVDWLGKQKEHNFLISKVDFSSVKSNTYTHIHWKKQTDAIISILSALPHKAKPTCGILILVRRLNHLNVRAEFIMQWSQGNVCLLVWEQIWFSLLGGFLQYVSNTSTEITLFLKEASVYARAIEWCIFENNLP